MPVFIEPDRTQYPPNFEAISCAGLEQLTGADMVISSIPIPPTINLTLHIANRSLFVQIKIGNDNLSFDAIHRFIARTQACEIPKNQAILLRIGEQWKDNEDRFRIRGQSSYGTTAWRDYRRMIMANGFRGITIFPECLSSIDDLPWIEDYQAIIQKIKEEGSRDIYPPPPIFQPDDIWQAVEEIRDWRRFFVSGLEGFGSKKANALFAYVSENYSGQQVSAYKVMCLMTDEDKKGKPLHKIPLWGNKSRKEFRGLLGIPEGWNLPELAYHLAFYQGWQSFGNEFARLVNKTGKPKEVHKKLMKEREKMITDFEGQIPF
jgi:hypothetical protein